MLVGISLVMASGCVFNNYHDREIDRRMSRTKKRALVTGAIPAANAIFYASALGITGFFVLGFFTNLLATGIALVGFVFYVLLYTPLKPRSVHATLVGSVAGAVPPVVGYTAVTGRFDIAALLLFLVLVFWQMPHFYAIAIYRFHDYYGAGIPVLPVKNGITVTKVMIALYIASFFVATSLLFVFHYTGYLYLLIMFLLSVTWFFKALQGFAAKEDAAWARGVFRFSLIVLLLFSLTISVNKFLV